MTATLEPPATTSHPAPGRRRIRRNPLVSATIYSALGALTVIWAAPLVWAELTSLKHEGETTTVPPQVIPDSGFTAQAYVEVLSVGDLTRWFVNSTIVAVAVTLLTLALSAAAAYGFSRTHFRGRRTLFAITVAGVMVPSQILIVPLYEQMLAVGLADTYPGVILPQIVVPAMVFILKKFFDAIPHELEEAARIDGAGPLRIFLTIVLPLSRPILAAVAIFVFIQCWNNFLWPFIILSDPSLMTLPVGLVQVQSSFGVRYAQVMAGAVLAGLPLVVAFLFFQRQIVQGIATTGLGGR